MKLLIVFTLLIFESGLIRVFAQTNSGVVNYTQFIRQDIDTSLYSETSMELIFDKNQALFKRNLNIESKFHGNYSATNIIVPLSPKSKYGFVYRNFQANTIACIENALTERIFMQDTIRSVEWQIGNERKKIGKFECVKAEVDYRGRHWVAWFAPEIAVSLGPWKLYGLPGLILEARNSTDKIRNSFESLQIPAPNNIIIEALEPKSGQKVMNRSQFVKQFIINNENHIKMESSKPQEFGTSTITTKLSGIEFYPEMEGKK